MRTWPNSQRLWRSTDSLTAGDPAGEPRAKRVLSAIKALRRGAGGSNSPLAVKVGWTASAHARRDTTPLRQSTDAEHCESDEHERATGGLRHRCRRRVEQFDRARPRHGARSDAYGFMRVAQVRCEKGRRERRKRVECIERIAGDGGRVWRGAGRFVRAYLMRYAAASTFCSRAIYLGKFSDWAKCNTQAMLARTNTWRRPSNLALSRGLKSMPLVLT